MPSSLRVLLVQFVCSHNSPSLALAHVRCLRTEADTAILQQHSSLNPKPLLTEADTAILKEDVFRCGGGGIGGGGICSK